MNRGFEPRNVSKIPNDTSYPINSLSYVEDVFVTHFVVQLCSQNASLLGGTELELPICHTVELLRKEGQEKESIASILASALTFPFVPSRNRGERERNRERERDVALRLKASTKTTNMTCGSEEYIQ